MSHPCIYDRSHLCILDECSTLCTWRYLDREMKPLNPEAHPSEYIADDDDPISMCEHPDNELNKKSNIGESPLNPIDSPKHEERFKDMTPIEEEQARRKELAEYEKTMSTRVAPEATPIVPKQKYSGAYCSKCGRHFKDLVEFVDHEYNCKEYTAGPRENPFPADNAWRDLYKDGSWASMFTYCEVCGKKKVCCSPENLFSELLNEYDFLHGRDHNHAGNVQQRVITGACSVYRVAIGVLSLELLDNLSMTPLYKEILARYKPSKEQESKNLKAVEKKALSKTRVKKPKKVKIEGDPAGICECGETRYMQHNIDQTEIWCPKCGLIEVISDKPKVEPAGQPDELTLYCEICGEKFTNLESILLHEDEKHSLVNKSKSRNWNFCLYCGEKVQNWTQSRHENSKHKKSIRALADAIRARIKDVGVSKGFHTHDIGVGGMVVAGTCMYCGKIVAKPGWGYIEGTCKSGYAGEGADVHHADCYFKFKEEAEAKRKEMCASCHELDDNGGCAVCGGSPATLQLDPKNGYDCARYIPKEEKPKKADRPVNRGKPSVIDKKLASMRFPPGQATLDMWVKA